MLRAFFGETRTEGLNRKYEIDKPISAITLSNLNLKQLATSALRLLVILGGDGRRQTESFDFPSDGNEVFYGTPGHGDPPVIFSLNHNDLIYRHSLLICYYFHKYPPTDAFFAHGRLLLLTES